MSFAPTAASPALPALVTARFPADKARRLCEALRRHAQGELPDLDAPPSRLVFVAWLIDQGRLTDDLPQDVPAAANAGTGTAVCEEARR